MNEKLKELLELLGDEGPCVDHVMDFTFEDENEEKPSGKEGTAVDENVNVFHATNPYVNTKNENLEKTFKEPMAEEEVAAKRDDRSSIVVGFKKDNLTSAEVVSESKGLRPNDIINAMLVAFCKKTASLLDIAFDKMFLEMSEALIGVISKVTAEEMFRMLANEMKDEE